MLNHLKIDVHTIVQDKSTISMNGSVILQKGSIPFQLYITEKEAIIWLDHASKPIRILNDSTDRFDQGLYQGIQEKVIPYLVRNLPNPNHISVEDKEEVIHGEAVNGHKIHAEIYGNEIPDLVLSFVDHFLKDKEAIEQIVKIINDSSTGQDKKTVTAQEIEDGLQQVKEMFAKNKSTLQEEGIFGKQNSIKMDILLDDHLTERKSTIDFVFAGLKETEGLQNIGIHAENESWNMNQPVQAEKINATQYLTEETTPKEFLSTLDKKQSVLYDVLMNDFHMMRKEIQFVIGDDTAIVNGEPTPLEQAPYIKKGSTLVLIRFAAEGLEAKVAWNSKTRQVVIQDDQTKIVLKAGDKTAYVNGKRTVLSVPAEIKQGRVFVPVRFVSESLKANVAWDAKTKTITTQREN